MKWYSLKYTNDMDDDQGGYARAWLVRIRPKYKDDHGLLQHELFHVSQWWKTLGLHSLLNLISKRYRLNSEVGAYKEQLKYEPAIHNPAYYKSMFAGYISTQYGLNITKEEAEKLL